MTPTKPVETTSIPEIQPREQQEVVVQTSTPTPASTPTPTALPVDPGQQAILDQLLSGLKQQGIPVESVKLVSFSKVNPPFAVEFTLLRGDGVGGMAWDRHAVLRAGYSAPGLGLNVGAVRIEWVDSEGKVTKSGTGIKTPVPPGFAPPFSMTDGAVRDALKQSYDLGKITLVNLEVSPDMDGSRRVTFYIRAQDVAAANTSLPLAVSKLGVAVGALNSAWGAQIASVRIALDDAAGASLLRYVRDIKYNSWSWSHVEGLVDPMPTIGGGPLLLPTPTPVANP